MTIGHEQRHIGIPELEELIQEATSEVEAQLSLEDQGWILLGAYGQDVLAENERIEYVKRSRRYFTLDPLAKQAIRLWTDYTFGSGMSWQSEDEAVTNTLRAFWNSRENESILKARGQRRSSDKLLVDGEVFFAVFLAPKGKATIRRIDPLEIAEIITDPDDIEKVLYYKRNWSNRQGQQKETYYRSTRNIKGDPAKDALGGDVQSNEGALIYHLTYNTIGQRGIPLLTPALDWIYEYRRFLASRVAIMLALARFAWKVKTLGGAAAVAAMQAVLDDKYPQAGSTAVESQGATLTPIKTESGAAAAYQDGRMLKLQVAAAVGIPEQYFGDISIGNLATAKTVELPMMKMFQSYQKVWADTYQELDEVVLEHAGVKEADWYVDRDFPPIAPEDAFAIAQAMGAIITAFPDFATSRDVQQQALLALGVNNPAEVLDAMKKEEQERSEGDVHVALAKALRQFKETLRLGKE